jgi:hypothetical protein
VVRDLVGLGDARQVLAEARVEGPDSHAVKALTGIERGVGGLPGHEPAHGTPGEPQLGQPLAQEPVAGHPEQDPTHARRASSLLPTRSSPIVAA